jgi:hypothetical protein
MVTTSTAQHRRHLWHIKRRVLSKESILQRKSLCVQNAARIENPRPIDGPQAHRNLPSAASAANTLTADEAKNHIGESATVCAVVAGTHYAEQTKGSPTFVNIGKPYPNQPFTVLIWGEDLPGFSPKPGTWGGKRVCETGPISSYQGRPETIAKAPGQIK